MSRSLQRIAGGCQESELRIVHHARAVKHRVLEIGRAARTFTQAGQEQLKQSYTKLIGLTQGVRTQGLSVLTAEILSKVVYRGWAHPFKITWLGGLLSLFFAIDESDTGDYLWNQFEALKPTPVLLGFQAEFKDHGQGCDS